MIFITVTKILTYVYFKCWISLLHFKSSVYLLHSQIPSLDLSEFAWVLQAEKKKLDKGTLLQPQHFLFLVCTPVATWLIGQLVHIRTGIRWT